MRRSAALVLPLLYAALSAAAGAATLEVLVQGEDGEPLRDAVVYALAEPDRDAADAPPQVEIDQVDKEFLPYVSAVRVGTRIHFPNRDQIRHHVYSFSEAKTFEIPLYQGTPTEPILFDRPGPVVLGCNIHDWMRAYVFVVETPWFAVTGEDGRARLDAPAGSYSLRVWHPELAGDPAQTARPATLAEGAAAELRFAIDRKRSWRPRRAPQAGGPDYR